MRVLRVSGVGQLCILLICSLIACCEECNENPDIEEHYITPDPPVYIGQERSLQVKVTDPDGDEVHCAWEAFDAGNVNVTGQVFKHGASGDSVKFKTDIDGTYMITVTAADLKGGHDAQSFQIVVLTSRIPVVSILSPKNETIVDGIVNISVKAVDDKGVIKVEFYIDGALIAEQNSPPFSYSWDAACVNGAHVIEVKAYDSDGNLGISSPVCVTVEGGVDITEPANGAQVDWETEVKGCKGVPEDQRIWVYVRPHTVGLWYPQGPPAEEADGTWSVLCYFGQEEGDQGAEFDVGVILVDEDKARDITEKLQEGDSGPKSLADPILAMITVKRR